MTDERFVHLNEDRMRSYAREDERQFMRDAICDLLTGHPDAVDRAVAILGHDPRERS